MLKNRLFVVSFALLSAVGTIAAPAPAEEVSLSYTASTLTFLAAKVALDQNFFRQEGLDVKFIQMRTAVNIPALANGLSSNVPLNDVVDFSLVKEIRAK